MISTVQLHWLAGLFEGEGCFGFTHSKHSYAFSSLAMTDRDVVERAALLISAKVYPRKPTREGHKPQWAIVLASRKAVALMMMLYPLMGARRKAQIRSALKEWKALPGYGARERRKAACPQGHAYTIYNDKGWRHCTTCRAARDRGRRRPALRIVNG